MTSGLNVGDVDAIVLPSGHFVNGKKKLNCEKEAVFGNGCAEN